MRREERVTVQGPVKEQQPDGMSHRGGGGGQGGVTPFPLKRMPGPSTEQNAGRMGTRRCWTRLHNPRALSCRPCALGVAPQGGAWG